MERPPRPVEFAMNFCPASRCLRYMVAKWFTAATMGDSKPAFLQGFRPVVVAALYQCALLPTMYTPSSAVSVSAIWLSVPEARLWP